MTERLSINITTSFPNLLQITVNLIFQIPSMATRLQWLHSLEKTVSDKRRWFLKHANNDIIILNLRRKLTLSLQRFLKRASKTRGE